MMKTVVKKMIVLAGAVLLLAGCAPVDQNADNSVVAGENINSSRMEKTYTIINQDEAKEMMKREDGHVIVDVRRQDEYDSGHIPGAILIPNESIGNEQPEQLPDPEQIILI